MREIFSTVVAGLFFIGAVFGGAAAVVYGLEAWSNYEREKRCLALDAYGVEKATKWSPELGCLTLKDDGAWKKLNWWEY